MPLFVLMTRLAPGSLKSAEGRRTAGRDWMRKVKQACPDVEWVGHYALLGPYDFMDIYNAPNTEMAHRVSLLSRAEGAVTAESWQAMPYEDFLHVFEDVESAIESQP